MATLGKQKITTSLWFKNEAEEAVKYYVSIFKNSRVVDVVRFGETGPGPAGSVMFCTFELEGQPFIAINGRPDFTFNEAVSLLVSCDSQEEIDSLWNKLIADGGSPSQCGWLKDKFGLSWQVTPHQLLEVWLDADPEKSKRVMEAMLQMSKIDLKKIEQARDGK